MRLRSAAALVILLFAACTGDSATPAVVSDRLAAIDPPAGEIRWQGLEKPVALRVDRAGRVLVADEASSTIRVFDEHGVATGVIGGAGSGPGEFSRLRDLAVGGKEIRVFDGVPGRFHIVSSGGAYLGTSPIDGVGDEMVSALGDSSLVLTSSARWSLPAKAGTPAWPLARIFDSNGHARFDIGTRASVKSPFAAHIRNFVIPAGSADGRFVWLAYLNSTDVLLVTTSDHALRSVPRPLPFAWVRIPENFMPSAPAAGQGNALPFDAITYGVATDSSGRAFVLTALES